MPLKFKNTGLRAQWWNYSSSASYFITVSTKDKTPFFGKVVDQEMVLNEIGKIVEEEWTKTAEIRKDMELLLFNFVVMPDHFHALIEIGCNNFNQQTNYKSDEEGEFVSFNEFGPQSKNLASIMRGFKSAVTMRARQINPQFQWQSRYYDIIIRSESHFRITQLYIENNPRNWGIPKKNKR